MQYTAYAHLAKESDWHLAEFPDAPGCHTAALSKKELRAAAREAILGWLEATILEDKPLAFPKHRLRPPRKSGWLLHVELPARYARAVKAHVERLSFRLVIKAPSDSQLKQRAGRSKR